MDSGKVIPLIPFGSWPSALSAEKVASNSVRLREPSWDGDDLYWLEGRPSEGGRQALVRQRGDGTRADVLTREFNARSRVHEYGGGSYVVERGVIYFTHFADNRVYCVRGAVGSTSVAPVALTEAGSAWRFADFVVDSAHSRLIAVGEQHGPNGEPRNALVAIAADGSGKLETLAEGSDFFASPRLSPDGKYLAWLSWNHPDMPWDSARLSLAAIDTTGKLTRVQTIAGSDTEAIYQPQWSPDGVLHFVSDRTGWWNLYAWNGNEAEALYPREAEFGLPHWVFGNSTYAFIGRGTILAAYRENGFARLGQLDRATKQWRELSVPHTKIEYVVASGARAAYVGARPDQLVEIVKWDGEARPIIGGGDLALGAGEVSAPEAIAFPTTDGATAHAFYYPPRNTAAQGPKGSKPPCLVLSHGGPTGATAAVLEPEIQFWTQRGFAVVDVNYRGSTGYGRAYREALYGKWGIADVDDCIAAARFLAGRGDIDAKRTAIRGGSAGGYTTLCALVFRDFFRAGASYYGVSDIEALQKDTHKFEAKYDQHLIARLPEGRPLFHDRSPIHFVDRLSCPVIFFQGLDDKVVPPNQTERMVDALKKKGLPVAYLPFAGEGHGFRNGANIRKALEAELAFYANVFGFKPADTLPELPIENAKK